MLQRTQDDTEATSEHLIRAQNNDPFSNPALTLSTRVYFRFIDEMLAALKSSFG